MRSSLSASPFLAVLLAGGATALAGCAEPPSVALPASTAAAPIEVASAPAVDDPPGANTCGLLVAAVHGATLMEPGVVDSIAMTSSTADAPVEDAAQRLAVAYAAAVAAKGTDGEPDAVAAVSGAGSEMSRVCDDSGLATVG